MFVGLSVTVTMLRLLHDSILVIGAITSVTGSSKKHYLFHFLYKTIFIYELPRISDSLLKNIVPTP